MDISKVTSLGAEFAPIGEHQGWWPREAMRWIAPYPTDWVKIVELTQGAASASRQCALIPLEHVAAELGRGLSLASEVGTVEIYAGRFHDGLVDPIDGRAEFFCQVRWQEPAPEPSVEWALPFLWYWRATRRGDRWIYIDWTGREVELARVSATSPDDYRVEVQAMALRHYLHMRGMAMLLSVQVDQDHPEASAVAREEHSLKRDWVSMEFQVYDYESGGPDRTQLAATSLHGQYVILPAANAQGPAWCTNEDPSTGPEFIYGIDASSGQELTAQPTRANVGVDGDPGPHFFTRVYFRIEVLNRYLAEPGRYTVSVNRIQCPHLWLLPIGRTSDGLIEIDMSDLSRIPGEWSHWKAHNVPPAGGEPDEGKLRRERLNQIASTPDTVAELRAAVARANEAATRHAGWPLWRPLTGQTATEWNALHPPVVDDRSALQSPLLTLSKVLVDSLDEKKIKQALVTQASENARSLALLSQYITELGGPEDAVEPLRELQKARSTAGFAHYAGASADKAFAAFAGNARNPAEIFERICRDLTNAIDTITKTTTATLETIDD